jgi:hypothetical protein
MLRHIWVETTCFDSQDDREQTEKDLCWFMEALTQRNQDYLRQRPDTPRLYKSGVVWEKPKQAGGSREAAILREALGSAAQKRDISIVLERIDDVLGGEHFCDIGVILELGTIDCDGLACWRAAELRQAGIKARPMMTSRKRIGGGTTYHAIVRWPPFGDAVSGNPYEESDEDPSLLLGMSQPDRAAERAEEIRKNIERCDYIKRSRTRGYVPGFDYQAALEGLFGSVAQMPQSAPMSSGVSREEDELQRIINRGVR